MPTDRYWVGQICHFFFCSEACRACQMQITGQPQFLVENDAIPYAFRHKRLGNRAQRGDLNTLGFAVRVQDRKQRGWREALHMFDRFKWTSVQFFRCWRSLLHGFIHNNISQACPFSPTSLPRAWHLLLGLKASNSHIIFPSICFLLVTVFQPSLP